MFHTYDCADLCSGANLSLTSLAKQSFLGGRYVTIPSPCGQDCTFAIDVPAPYFNCLAGTAMSSADFATIQNYYFKNSSSPVGSSAANYFNPLRWSYIA